MALVIFVDTGPGRGLLPDGTKPLPHQVFTYHQWSLLHSHDKKIAGSAQDINS